MKKICKGIWFSLFVFLFMGVMKEQVFADYISVTADKRVLYIGSYNEEFLSVSDELAGIHSVFNAQGIDLDVEFMDTKLYPEEENLLNFYDTIKYKLEHTKKYDAVITAHDAALQFVLDYQEELFEGIPVYFYGINDFARAETAAENPYMTGAIEKASIEDNISLGRSMISGASKVVGIVDSTLTGIGDKKQLLEAETEFSDLTFTILSTADYSFDELASELQKIDSSTIVILFTLSRDKEGNYIDLQDQFAFISSNVNAPVFRISIGGVGDGLLGGKMIDYREFGVRAANTITDIFGGKDVGSISLDVDTPYHYVFDNNILEKYNISADTVPDGSIIINENINPLVKYKKYIMLTCAVIAVLTVFAIVLVIDNIKRRKMQKALLESNEELQQIYEELMASEEELKTQYETIENHAKEVSSLYQKYETAISGTNSAVWEFNLETRLIEISQNFEKIFGKNIPTKGNVYNVLNKLTEKEIQKEVIDMIQKYIHEEIDEVNIQIPFMNEKGEKRWILLRGNGIFDLNGKLTDMTGIFLDITNEKAKEEYIEYFARHDYLTNLPNRMDFETVLSEELRQNRSGALLLFDVDDFKSINDTMGHSFGDEILKQIADRLKKLCDSKVYVARMGGDEFFILVKGAENEAALDCFLTKINQVISQAFVYGAIEEFINCSIGITFYPKDSNNINQLMMNADTAMYRVKKSGKNNYVFYHEDMKKELRERKEVENVLRQATKDGNFELLYQPEVDAYTGEITGFEALLRLSGFQVSPAVFIPIAEETGDIVEIGRWVAKEAISQMARWKEKGFPEKIMALNYSVKQLRDKGFLDYILALLKEYNIAPEYLEIEVTEGILMEKTEATIRFLHNIRNAGIRLALDDFGSGYSSLSYLTFLPVNKIKLDKSINDKFLDIENLQVMDSIISLIHGLKLSITAEGIEDYDKFKKLKTCGCNTIQGYLFSRPLKAYDIEQIYNKIYPVDGYT